MTGYSITKKHDLLKDIVVMQEILGYVLFLSDGTFIYEITLFLCVFSKRFRLHV